MAQTRKRKVTREMGKAETWLQNHDERVERERRRAAIAISDLATEREEYIASLPDDVRDPLISAKVIAEDWTDAPAP